MKKYLFIIMIALVASLCSCNDDIELEKESSCVTRAIVDGKSTSVSNPDLINNWENISKIVLNTMESGSIAKSVTPPWVNGTSSSLSETFRKDIKKADGWKMLYHTFKKVGLDAKQNYMCFYNQFTGYIKIFYYYEGENSSQGTQWFVRTSGGQKVKLLGESKYLSEVKAGAAMNDILLFSNMINNPTAGIEPGWNGFEFLIPYSVDYKNMDFIIGAYDKRITGFNFIGKETSSTVGTITTTKQKSPGIYSAVANLGGSEAKNFIDKLAPKVKLGEKLSKLITSIPVTSYASAIKGGLNLIFGKTTTNSVSEVKLTTTSEIIMEGTSSSEATSGIPSLSFNLYEILNPSGGEGNIAEHYLGVWTLKDKPTVYYNRVTLIENCKITPDYSDPSKVIVSGVSPIPQIQKSKYEVVFNPDLEPYISNKKSQINFIICNKLDGEMLLPRDVNDLGDVSLLYKDDSRELYEINNTCKIAVPGLWSVEKPTSPKIYMFDWGDVTNGRLLAVVSVSFTYTFQGKSVEANQTRTYNVEYGIDPTQNTVEELHNSPRRTFVLNYGYPYFQDVIYW